MTGNNNNHYDNKNHRIRDLHKNISGNSGMGKQSSKFLK